MIFGNLEQVLAAISTDQQRLHLPIKQAYYVDYRPRKLNYRRIIRECKYCKSRLYLQLVSEKKLLVILARHTTSIRRVSSKALWRRHYTKCTLARQSPRI